MSRGYSLSAVHELLIAVASLVWRTGSVVVAGGLSCSAACGIFADQVLNLCPLHCQEDS